MAEQTERQNEICPERYLMQMLWWILRWFFLVCICFIILYPLLYMVSMAFRSPEDFADVTVIWIPKHLTLDNLRTAIDAAGLRTAMMHTALIALGSTVLQVLMTSLTGYGFARFRFRGRGLLFAFVILTIVIPPQMMNIPNHLLMKELDVFGIVRLLTGAPSPVDLLDTYGSFYLPAVLGQGLRAGLFILVYRQAYAGMPVELEEAAWIDGCGYAKTYLRIMFPNARTTSVVTFLFSLVWYWTDYYMPFTLLSEKRTLSVLLLDLSSVLSAVLPAEQRNAYYLMPMHQAACLFSVAPLLILFLLAQKQFVRAIDRSGIVG